MEFKAKERSPRVIHTKKNVDIHVKKKAEASEKINVIKQRGKHKFQEDRRKQLSRKTNKGTMKLVGTSMGAKVASDQLEGGEEVYQAGMMAYEGVAFARGTVEGGVNIGKKAILSHRKHKLKVVEAKKRKVLKKAMKERLKAVSKKAAKKQVKRQTKKVAKTTTKVAAKTTTKVATTVVVSAAGSTVLTPVGGMAVGYLAGEVAGAVVDEKIDKLDRKLMEKNRKLAFFLDKLKPQDQQQDSLFRTIRDVMLMKLQAMIKRIYARVGIWFSVMLLMIFIVSVPIVGLVAMIYNSPFAVFFPAVEVGDTVQSEVAEYELAFQQEVQAVVALHNGHDEGEMVYIDYEGMSALPSNYYDVIMVYMVRYGMEEMATVMNDTTRDQLRGVFDDMTSYSTTTREERSVFINDEGEEIEEIVRILQGQVFLKSYHDMIEVYGFNEEQVALLEELMSPDNLAYLGYTGGMGGSGDGTIMSALTANEIAEIVKDVEDETIKQTLTFALSKVGYPYSQAYRDSGNYYDCSSLMYYAYQSAGINISYGGATTAAAECQGLDAAGKSVSFSQIQPGDLVFYSYANNGRYKNIGHVAMYVGNGKVVEAANTKLGVIYRDIPSVGSIVAVGRPK